MKKTEIKFEVTFISDEPEEYLDMLDVWLKNSMENLVYQQCEIDSFKIKKL